MTGCLKMLKAFETEIQLNRTNSGNTGSTKLARTNSNSSAGGKKRRSSLEPSSQDSGISLTPKYNPPASSGAAKGKGSGGGMPSRKRVGGDGDGDDRYEATQEIDFHESEVSKVSDELSAAYVKADKFDGHRDGYVYTRGSRGLGYYTYEGPVNKKLKADTSDSVSGGGGRAAAAAAADASPVRVARGACDHAADADDGTATPVLPCFCECDHATPHVPQKPTPTTMTLTHARSGIWRNIACDEELTVGRVAGLYGWGVYDRDWSSPCFRSPNNGDMQKSTSRICFKISSSGSIAAAKAKSGGGNGAGSRAGAPTGHKWYLEVITETNTVHLRSGIGAEVQTVTKSQSPILLTPGKHVVAACPYNCVKGFCAEPTYGPLAYLLEIPGQTIENQAAWTVRP